MNHRLKKALLYGVWFTVLAPLMGVLSVAVFVVLPITFFLDENFMGFMSFVDLIVIFFGALLLSYIIFGLPAFFTGVIFIYCYHRPYLSLISGAAGALFSFIFAFLLNAFFSVGSFFTGLRENIFTALGCAVLAFILGTLLAFLFKRTMED